MISRCLLTVIIFMIVWLAWTKFIFGKTASRILNLSPTPEYNTTPNNKVVRFMVTVTIPDLDNKFFEGGFYLYLDSPDLAIRRMISYSFDTGQTVRSKIFDISNEMVSYNKFKDFLTRMVISTNSDNVYNASQVGVLVELEDGTIKTGSKALDPQLDRSYEVGDIKLDGIL